MRIASSLQGDPLSTRTGSWGECNLIASGLYAPARASSNQDDDVPGVPFHERKGFFRGPGSPPIFKSACDSNTMAQPTADHGVIVSDQDSNHTNAGDESCCRAT